MQNEELETKVYIWGCIGRQYWLPRVKPYILKEEGRKFPWCYSSCRWVNQEHSENKKASCVAQSVGRNVSTGQCVKACFEPVERSTGDSRWFFPPQLWWPGMTTWELAWPPEEEPDSAHARDHQACWLIYNFPDTGNISRINQTKSWRTLGSR